MDIQVTKNEKTLTIELEGRLDTITSPQLEKTLKQEIADSESLIFVIEMLSYISLAGLRVLLAAQKVLIRQGTMVIRHVNETIMEVFEVTGFIDFLTVEQD